MWSAHRRSPRYTSRSQRNRVLEFICRYAGTPCMLQTRAIVRPLFVPGGDAKMNDSELRSFFESYGDAFLRSPADIADFYAAPCITARQGQVRLNATRADVEAFFTDVLAGYRALGGAAGEIKTLASTPLG